MIYVRNILTYRSDLYGRIIQNILNKMGRIDKTGGIKTAHTHTIRLIISVCCVCVCEVRILCLIVGCLMVFDVDGSVLDTQAVQCVTTLAI